MTDYYETKSQPITRLMVWQAYWKVRANKGGAGIDGMNWEVMDKNRKPLLYKLWNRLTSGSYFPPPVKGVGIKKKDGGTRELGIPTILDRIAQEVVRAHLEPILEPKFHDSSYGYRKGRNCHMAVEQATKNSLQNHWAIDLDIKGFFDSIDHDLMLTAVKHYCNEPWVLMYVERWLKAGVMQSNGILRSKLNGTPQGGVISPLLSNLFLHVAFDKWMEKNHSEKPFERYADDIVIHCKTEKQALYLKSLIEKRMRRCKLDLHPVKTKIVHFRGEATRKYPRSLDFLGFTIRLQLVQTKVGAKLMTTSVISRKARKSILEKFRSLHLHKKRGNIERLSKLLTPIVRGLMNYYCKFWSGHTKYIWHRLNIRLTKWIRWEKDLSTRASIKYLKAKYKENPGLFPHWKLVHP
jgi:group II intron reverse transcriptase/maturase